jgi:hypothetical protein
LLPFIAVTIIILKFFLLGAVAVAIAVAIAASPQQPKDLLPMLLLMSLLLLVTLLCFT